MSKKTVVITTCNGCNTALDETESSHAYTVNTGRKQYEIDLCSVCDDTFVAFIGMSVPKPKKRLAPARRPIKSKTQPDVPCPECNRVFLNAHGLQVHVARSHKKK